MKVRLLSITLILLVAWPVVAAAQLTSGLQGAAGSAIGPGGDLYVTQGDIGEVTRIDRVTGDQTAFAVDLPVKFFPFFGGPVDVAFIGGTAYVLVSLTDPFAAGEVGGFAPAGIYRVDGYDSNILIADLGAWSAANPPTNTYDLPAGVQYAIEAYRGGLLVSDGHHDRVLWVALDGTVTQIHAENDTVPTGLETWGRSVLVAESGIVPHLPEDGRVVAVDAKTGASEEVATGARLAVDVEFGLGRTLYVLSQGEWNMLGPGSSALPFTGALFRVESDGTMTEMVSGLNLPTSMEIVGNTAYVVNLAGEVWVIDHLDDEPPYGVK